MLRLDKCVTKLVSMLKNLGFQHAFFYSKRIPF